MKKIFTKILAVVGLVIGLSHPSNYPSVDILSGLAFSLPFVLFFSFIGFCIDFLIFKFFSKPKV